MKIVQINGTYGHGDSTGGTTKEMSEWLVKNGHSVNVYASYANNNYESDKFVHYYSSKMERLCHGLMSRITGMQGFFSKAGTQRLLKDLGNIHPDIVILRVLHNNSVNFEMLFSWLKKQDIPFVLVLHDCWYYTGHCCYYTQYGCEKWRKDCCKCDHIRDWNPSWFFNTSKICLKKKKFWFDNDGRYAVIGVSNWVTEDAKESILSKARFIKRIYNWIDLEVFCPLSNQAVIRERHNIKANRRIIFAAATEWPVNKGYDEIVEIHKRIKEAVIIVAGDIDLEEDETLIKLGHIKYPQRMAEYYSAADVFVNPSNYETFGKTTAEALSCGTPVVAYDTTGSRELVSNKTGEKVSYDIAENRNIRIDKFLASIRTVLNKGKELYTLECRKFATEHFDIEKNMMQYMDVFRELCE